MPKNQKSDSLHISFIIISFFLMHASPFMIVNFEGNRPFSHCIDQAGLGAFTAKSGRKHYNPLH